MNSALETALRNVLDVADVTNGPIDPTKIHDAIGHELVYLLMTYHEGLPKVESTSRSEIFADVALLLHDRARMWREENRPTLAQECSGLAFAYEQYSSGNGLPSMEMQRDKIRHLAAQLEATRRRAERVTRENEQLKAAIAKGIELSTSDR